MDFDFHYYGTKAASLLAGFEEQEAEMIAESALFVDYCDWHNFGYLIGSEKEKTFTIQTSQFNSPVLDSLESTGNGDPSIWAPFHFMPGNYEHSTPHEKFKLVETDVSRSGVALCRPYSQLCDYLIQDTRETIETYNLTNRARFSLIGIRMHVLADSWAHQNFSGLPDNFWQRSGLNSDGLNQVYGDVQKKTDKGWENIQWVTLEGESGMLPNIFKGVGHGAAGHTPDMGWLTFQYKPTWAFNTSESAKNYVVRDNPEEFCEAFLGLVDALYFIKNGKHPDIQIVSKEQFLFPKGGPQVHVPQTILNMIVKDRGISDRTSHAFKDSANGWEEYFNQCQVPVKKFSEDPNFADKLIASYRNDIYNPKTLEDLDGIKDGIGESLLNQISGIYQSAEIKTNSPFYWFQKAAKWHLKYIMEKMEAIPVLEDVTREIKANGWSYRFGVGHSLDDIIY